MPVSNPGNPGSGSGAALSVAPHAPLVLVVDSQEWSGRSFESFFAPADSAVVRVPSAAEALERTRTLSPDLVVINADLEDMSGMQLCRTLRDRGLLGPSVPVFLVLSGPVQRDRRLAALEAGAWECIGLPLDPEEILLKAGTYLLSKLHADRAIRESLLDRETGLYSANGLLHRVREFGLAARRYRRSLACLVIAPDEGDPGGAETDEARAEIRILAERLARLVTSEVRGSDAAGRLSVSEFVLLCPDTDAEAALGLARRLCEASPLALRIGCHAVPDFGEAGIEPAEMLVRATIALRRVQRTGAAERILFL